MPKLEAVVEGVDELDEFPWSQTNCLAPDHMRVHPAMSDEDIGFVIACLLRSREPYQKTDAKHAFQEIIDGYGLIWFGGIRTVDEENGLVINPGCCCGLEGWWEWLKFVTEGGDYGPWLGHDPNPGVEQTPWGYRVWSGLPEGFRELEVLPDDVKQYFIDFQGDELKSQVEQVQRDLIGFLEAVRVWAFKIDPELAEALVQKIDEQFSITNPYRNFPYDYWSAPNWSREGQ